MPKWCTACRVERDTMEEDCPWCGETLVPERPASALGKIMVFGAQSPVAASLLLARLADLGIPAEAINRPDVYWGSRGVWFPHTFQVLVREDLAEARREDIKAAIRDVEEELSAENDEAPPA